MTPTATILPGQWTRHLGYEYAVWVHRLARAAGKEIDRLPEQARPLPWPVLKKPVNELRTYNSGLFPKFPVKPKRSPHLNSYVPRTVDLSAARTEVYGPAKGENFLWRIRICGDHPRPWSIEAVVDPGGAVYLPFFREVTMRLPLKAKICRELAARADGRWVGECRKVKKLNAREPIVEATRWLLETGQAIRPPVKREQRTAGRPSRGSAAHGSLLTAHSHRRRPLEGAMHVEGFVRPDPWGLRYPPRVNLARQEREREQFQEVETEAIMGMINNHTGMPDFYFRPRPDFLERDDHDGFLLTRAEMGPDPYQYRRPQPHRRRTRCGRELKRALTARERLAKVEPSARIVPTGPRSAELVITRRLHELSFGLGQALDLARFIEGASKYRNPLQPGRKRSWRQQLRSTILYRHGLLTWLVRNPIDQGPAATDHEGYNAPAAGSGSAVKSDSAAHGALLTAHSPARASRGPAAHGSLLTAHLLPKPYLELVDRRWLTSDGNLFEATPGGGFATTIEGFALRLPLAVMPPESYERWRARARHPRARGQGRGSLRRRKQAGCTCFSAPPDRATFPNARKTNVDFTKQFAREMNHSDTNGTKKTKFREPPTVLDGEATGTLNSLSRQPKILNPAH